MLLHSLLDLRAEASEGALYASPILPDLLPHLSLRNLRLGDSRVDLHVERDGDGLQMEMRGPREVRLEALTA
jgi:hypothetical protein